jgi:hypothetical protein
MRQTKPKGSKKYPGGTLLVAVSRVASGAQLGRGSPLFARKMERARGGILDVKRLT